MISIIISTYQPNFLEALKINIEQTIGIPYEIIAIENKGEKGICEVYNAGTSKAQYDILCFCHEDILFQTNYWGQIVIDIFNNNKSIGLLGVAGSTYKTAAPAGWGFIPEARSVNIIQHHKFLNIPTYKHYENPKQKPLTSVACIDGVWMCTTKKIALEKRFDQNTLTSFHCYDIDFSLNILKNYQVAVTFDILLDHFSEGKNDKFWIIENIKLHKKWSKFLPVNLDNIPVNIIEEYETSAGVEFVHLMGTLGFSTMERLKLLNGFIISKYMQRFKIFYLIIRVTGSSFKKKLFFR